MQAKSIKGKTIDEIRSQLEQITAEARPSARTTQSGGDGDDPVVRGFKPTLAIVFLSVKQDRAAISELLDENGIAIFGVTTNGEFIDEEADTGSAAILLLDINKDHFQVYFEEYPDKNYREVSRNIAERAIQKFSKPAFLIGISHAAADGEEILHGLEEVVGAEVNAFGGAAGDDYGFIQTFTFTNRKDSDHAIVCLVLDESKIKVQGIATCGWKAVGTEKTVTRSEGNHVYTVDHIPALDITAKFGGLENVNPENKDLFVELAAYFPLQLQREKGDPVMRPGLVVDWSDHSFYTSGSVPQGSKVRFSLPPDFDVMDKVVKGVENLKETVMPEADALVVFSCAGRIISLGPLMSKEIEGVKNVWNVPMAGMFSNAELGRATGGNLEMHNLTTCCIALKEK